MGTHQAFHRHELVGCHGAAVGVAEEVLEDCQTVAVVLDGEQRFTDGLKSPQIDRRNVRTAKVDARAVGRSGVDDEAVHISVRTCGVVGNHQTTGAVGQPTSVGEKSGGAAARLRRYARSVEARVGDHGVATAVHLIQYVVGAVVVESVRVGAGGGEEIGVDVRAVHFVGTHLTGGVRGGEQGDVGVETARSHAGGHGDVRSGKVDAVADTRGSEEDDQIVHIVGTRFGVGHGIDLVDVHEVRIVRVVDHGNHRVDGVGAGGVYGKVRRVVAVVVAVDVDHGEVRILRQREEQAIAGGYHYAAAGRSRNFGRSVGTERCRRHGGEGRRRLGEAVRIGINHRDAPAADVQVGTDVAADHQEGKQVADALDAQLHKASRVEEARLRNRRENAVGTRLGHLEGGRGRNVHDHIVRRYAVVLLVEGEDEELVEARRNRNDSLRGGRNDARVAVRGQSNGGRQHGDGARLRVAVAEVVRHHGNVATDVLDVATNGVRTGEIGVDGEETIRTRRQASNVRRRGYEGADVVVRKVVDGENTRLVDLQHDGRLRGRQHVVQLETRGHHLVAVRNGLNGGRSGGVEFHKLIDRCGRAREGCTGRSTHPDGDLRTGGVQIGAHPIQRSKDLRGGGDVDRDVAQREVIRSVRVRTLHHQRVDAVRARLADVKARLGARLANDQVRTLRQYVEQVVPGGNHLVAVRGGRNGDRTATTGQVGRGVRCRYGSGFGRTATAAKTIVVAHDRDGDVAQVETFVAEG